MLRYFLNNIPFFFIGWVMMNCWKKEMWVAFAFLTISAILLLVRNIMDELKKYKER